MRSILSPFFSGMNAGAALLSFLAGDYLAALLWALAALLWLRPTDRWWWRRLTWTPLSWLHRWARATRPPLPLHPALVPGPGEVWWDAYLRGVWCRLRHADHWLLEQFTLRDGRSGVLGHCDRCHRAWMLCD